MRPAALFESEMAAAPQLWPRKLSGAGLHAPRPSSTAGHSAAMRSAAVHVLGEMAEVCAGDEHVMSTCTKHMDSPDAAIRSAAVLAFSKLAKPGDRLSTRMACERLKSEDYMVRETGLVALSLVAPRNDADTIKRVGHCLEDAKPQVRQAAAAALAKVGDSAAIAEELLARCAHPSDEVKVSAMDAAAAVLPRGHEAAVEAVKSSASSASVELKQVAARALASIALPGDGEAVAWLKEQAAATHLGLKRESYRSLAEIAPNQAEVAQELVMELHHPCEEVRCWVSSALSQLGQRCTGIAGPIPKEEVYKCLDSVNPTIRESAAYCLPGIVMRGDLDASIRLRHLLTDPNFEVQKAALRALAIVVRPKDERTLAALVRYVGSSPEAEAQILYEVAVAMKAISPEEDVVTALRLAERAKHHDEHVRFGTTRLLAWLAESSDVAAISILGQCMLDKERYIREYALDELTAACRKGMSPSAERCAIRVVANHLTHPDACLRAQATKAITKISRPGDDFTLDCVCQHMQHPDARVREAVARTLGFLAVRQSSKKALKALQYDVDPDVREAALRETARKSHSSANQAASGLSPHQRSTRMTHARGSK